MSAFSNLKKAKHTQNHNIFCWLELIVLTALGSISGDVPASPSSGIVRYNRSRRSVHSVYRFGIGKRCTVHVREAPSLRHPHCLGTGMNNRSERLIKWWRNNKERHVGGWGQRKNVPWCVCHRIPKPRFSFSEYILWSRCKLDNKII